jgi:hypothetical protein
MTTLFISNTRKDTMNFARNFRAVYRVLRQTRSRTRAFVETLKVML